MENILELPNPNFTEAKNLEHSIGERKSVRSFSEEPLTLQEVSNILWAAGGVKEAGLDAMTAATRTFPSAGACYPLEFYIVTGENSVKDLDPGVYYYDPEKNALNKIETGDRRGELSRAAMGQKVIRDAPVNVVITAYYERTTQRYGQQRGTRYVHMDAGHSGQNIYLAAESLNLGTVAIGAFNDSGVAEVLNTDRETPLYIYPVGKQ